MGDLVKVKSRAIFSRNRLGQFARECDNAATRTVEETIKRGAASARALAPGPGYNVASYSQKPGYIPLKRSIRAKMTGSARGEWYSVAPHALFVELGTGAHMIRGKMRFYWRGGLFIWNRPEFGPVGSGKPYENWDAGGAWVRHPGTGAQPFLRPSYDKVSRQMLSIAEREYPG